MKRKLIYNFLSDDDLLRISNKITEAEKTTSGEIRVVIKEKKPLLKSFKPVNELAKEEFFRTGMDKTRDKTGILLFVMLKERSFYILADSGINEKVSQTVWDAIRNEMQQHFQSGNFSKGLQLGIAKVGEVLAAHFPIKSDDTNELSNRVGM
jgi:uncharacterized membrane protein